jgi:hypothetical protein
MEFKDKGKPKEGARHDPQHDLPQRLRMKVSKAPHPVYADFTQQVKSA